MPSVRVNSAGRPSRPAPSSMFCVRVVDERRITYETATRNLTRRMEANSTDSAYTWIPNGSVAIGVNVV